jgi:hypothetical protein
MFFLCSRDSLNAPLPGTIQRPGAPAPTGNTRLSMGASGKAGSTTVRLVGLASSASAPADIAAIPAADQGLSIWDSPPKLPAYKTSFDLIMGSPGGAQSVWPHSSASEWPTSPTPAKRLYPSLPLEDAPPHMLSKPDADADVGMPGGFDAGPVAPTTPVTLRVTSPQSATTASASSYTIDGAAHTRTSVMNLFPPPPAGAVPGTPSRSQAFAFGSPAASVSNQQFAQAAESVLSEMNARLGLTGDAAITADILNVNKFEGPVQEVRRTR